MKKFASRGQGSSRSVTTTHWLVVCMFAALVAMTASCGGPDDIGPLNKADVTTTSPDVGTTADTTSTPAVECMVATDCDDGKKSSIESCVDGKCVHKAVECYPGFVFNEVGECIDVQVICPSMDDGKPCTIDSCDVATGEVLHLAKPCNDGVDITLDSCDVATGDCVHSVDCGDCNDEDPCTKGTCDPKTGQCVQEDMNLLCEPGDKCIEGTCKQSCTADADCSDNDWCTLDSCDQEFGKCEHSARDCSDNDVTTVDVCVPGGDNNGACENIPTACTGGCEDGDLCTSDFCQNDECVHLPKTICGLGTQIDKATCTCEVVKIQVECTVDAECDDGNGCTTDECEANACTHPLVECPIGTLCDNKSGDCKLLDKCPQGCDDGDACTADICQNGICVPGTVPSCGSGTALNPATCQCEVAKSCFDEGVVKCDQFNIAGLAMLVWTVCSNGVQTVVKNCGAVNMKISCANDTGCSNAPTDPPPPAPPPPAPAGSSIGFVPKLSGFAYCWAGKGQYLGKFPVTAQVPFTCPATAQSVVSDQASCGSCLVNGQDAGVCHPLNPDPGFGCQL